MGRSRTAVVVGGRIGGLAVAGALVRAGWSTTVLERAAEYAAVGAGISLSPNAVRALDGLGLGERPRARAVAKGAVGLRTRAGGWLMRTSAEALADRYGVWANPVAGGVRNALTRLLPTGTYLRSSDDTLSWQPPSTTAPAI